MKGTAKRVIWLCFSRSRVRQKRRRGKGGGGGGERGGGTCCKYMKFIPVLLNLVVERFSNECRKTKTKVIILANHKDIDNPVNQSKLEANTCSRCKARENEHERVMIGFAFTSDWSRKKLEFFKPITKRSNAKPKQKRITFDTQMKNYLNNELLLMFDM